MFKSKLTEIINDGIVTPDAARYLIASPEEYLTLIKTSPSLALSFANFFNTQQVDTLVENAHRENNKILSKIAAIPGVFHATHNGHYDYTPERFSNTIAEVCQFTNAPERSFTARQQIMRQHITICVESGYSKSSLIALFTNDPLRTYEIAHTPSYGDKNKPTNDEAYTVDNQDGQITYKKWKPIPNGSYESRVFYNAFSRRKVFVDMATTSITTLTVLLNKIGRSNPSAEPNLDTAFFSREVPNLFKSTLYDYQLGNLQLLLKKSNPITSLQELLKRDSGEEPVFSQLVEKLSGENQSIVTSIMQTITDKLTEIDESKGTLPADAKLAIVASMPSEALQKIANHNTQLAWSFINAASKQMRAIHNDFYQRVFATQPSAPPPMHTEGAGSSSSSSTTQTQPKKNDAEKSITDNASAPAETLVATDENAEQNGYAFMYIFYAAANLGVDVLRGLLHPLLEPNDADQAEDDKLQEQPPAYTPPSTNPLGVPTAPPLDDENLDATHNATTATTAPQYHVHMPAASRTTENNLTNGGMYPDLTKDSVNTGTEKNSSTSKSRNTSNKHKTAAPA